MLSRRTIASLLLLVSAGDASAIAPTACNLLTKQVDNLRYRIDSLKLDYPRPFRQVCMAVNEAVEQNDPRAVLSLLPGQREACIAAHAPAECDAVITGLTDIARRMSDMHDFARVNNCAVPHFPDAC